MATSQSIAELVLKEAKDREAKRVLKVEIEIGALTFLNPEQVDFWVQMSFQGTLAEGAELRITAIEPVVVCPACGYQGPLQIEEDPLFHQALPRLQCPKCGATELRIERGRECTLRRVELLCE